MDIFRGLADVAAGPLDEGLLQAFHNMTIGAIQRRHKRRLSMNQVESGHVYGVHNDCFPYTISSTSGRPYFVIDAIIMT